MSTVEEFFGGSAMLREGSVVLCGGRGTHFGVCRVLRLSPKVAEFLRGALRVLQRVAGVTPKALRVSRCATRV